jgi:hypothetical protein
MFSKSSIYLKEHSNPQLWTIELQWNGAKRALSAAPVTTCYSLAAGPLSQHILVGGCVGHCFWLSRWQPLAYTFGLCAGCMD